MDACIVWRGGISCSRTPTAIPILKKYLLILILFSACSSPKQGESVTTDTEQASQNTLEKLQQASAYYQEAENNGDDALKNELIRQAKNTILAIDEQAYAQDSLLKFSKSTILTFADNYELDSANKWLHDVQVAYLKDTLYQGLYQYLTGYILDYEEQYAESIAAYQKSIALLSAKPNDTSMELALAYNDLAYVYSEVSLESEALKNYKLAYELIWQNHRKSYPELASAANNYLGALASYGDFATAERVQTETAEVFEHFLKGPQNIEQEKAFDMLSIFYLGSLKSFQKEKYKDKVPLYVKRMETLFATTPTAITQNYRNRLSFAYDQAGYAYLKAKDFEKAEGVFGQMSQVASNDYEAMKAKSNFAALYLQSKQYALAEKTYQETIAQSTLENKHISLLMLHAAKAWMQIKQSKYEPAKATIQTLWDNFLPRNKTLDKLVLEDLAMANSSRWMFILNVSAEVFRKNYVGGSKKKEDLAAAKNLAMLAGEMFQKYYEKEAYNEELNAVNNQSREELMQLMPYFSESEKIAAISLLENNSSRHLWKNFLAKNQERLLAKPELLEKRNRLKILQINQEANEAYEQELATIDQEIEQQIPGFLTNQYTDIQLPLIQQKLKDKRGLLRYLQADEWVYAYYLTQSSIDVYTIGKVSIIDSLAKSYYQQLTSLDKEYTPTGQKLYQMLLSPIDLKGAKSLTIICENSLLNIPFESLSTTSGKPLTHKIPISYSHSMHFELNEWTENSRKNKLIAYAPSYHQKGDLAPLANTKQEVSQISKAFNGDKLTGEKASKSVFINQLGAYNVQHLAMHAVLDTSDYENSSLVFADEERLQFKEIFALNFPADLVTLSACNTGIGTYRSGEGLMSLSKALFYAGTKAVVHSLWRVPDEETAEIMGYFYENLAQGMHKDIALQKAKIAFFQKNPLKQHPYFWAGFVLTGHREALKNTSILSYWPYAIALLMVAIVLYFFSTSRRSNA